jgi:tetratricopeptide (TPR) repeat protein
MYQVSAPVAGRLAGKSKEELIVLIQEMLKREPELERLLDLPLKPDPGSPLDLTGFRRQIDLLFEEDFVDPAELALELGAIVETGDRFSAQENWLAAGAIYHLILSEIVLVYDRLYDEDGDITGVLQECAQGLEKCLTEGTPDSPTRKSWFEALLEAEFKDIEMGGIDLAYPAQDILVEHTTDEEWREIEARVREKIGSLKEGFSSWGREALVNLLARRLERTGREEEVSDLIFDWGSEQQQAFELLRQRRFAEAVAIAEKHFVDLPGLVLQFADALVHSGGTDEAIAYVTGQLGTRYRSSYLNWLAKLAEKQLDHPTALEWWLKLFRESPDLEIYRNLGAVARRLEQWDSLRRHMIGELESKEGWDLLIEIALEEGNVARALELLPRQRWGRHELKVAQAAETDYPQASIEIYCQAVDSLITGRGRDNYQAAA